MLSKNVKKKGLSPRCGGGEFMAGFGRVVLLLIGMFFLGGGTASGGARQPPTMVVGASAPKHARLRLARFGAASQILASPRKSSGSGSVSGDRAMYFCLSTSPPLLCALD